MESALSGVLSAPRWWRWHRWLAWLVGLQVAAWMLGGALFAWLPFQGWVKSADVVVKPTAVWPDNWAAALASASMPASRVTGVAGIPTALGPAWQIRRANQPDLWLDARGQPLRPPEPADVAAFADALYRGLGRRTTVERVTESPRHAGIVREVGARRDLWRVRFDDALSTRIYVDATTGQFVAARNDAWVVYDFFWRLHIMDYSEGEDFNNPLLRGAVVCALALVTTGVVLALLALRRRWRHARPAGTAGR